MKNMSVFQLVLTGAFGFFILLGVIFFSLSRSGSSGVVSNITIWGTLTPSEYAVLEKTSGIYDDDTLIVTYKEVSEMDFDTVFVNALARGEGPDLVLMESGLLLKHVDKLVTIPYESYPRSTFEDTFIEAGDILLTQNGILGIPFSIDPMVMYWNRTLFNNVGIANPPSFWDQMYNVAQVFGIRDNAFNISQSGVALGEYSNITHAKELLSALIMQAGGKVTKVSGTTISSDLMNKAGQTVIPAEAIVNYYTQFSNPNNAYYSWNRSLPGFQDFFVSGDLAVYFGLVSEAETINLKNPNLNFQVTTIPQARNASEKITYGQMNILAIPRASSKVSSAFRAINLLTSNATLSGYANMSGLPPVRLDLQQSVPLEDASARTFYTSALWSRLWFDPDPERTEIIFKDMVESVTSGRESVSSSVQTASTRLQDLLENISLE